MKNKVIISFAVAAGLLAVCGPMFAHHGNSAYADKVVVLKEATVTKFTWANPHSILMLDVKDGKGNVVPWAGELGSPSALALIGWTKSSVQPGDKITAYIFQSKTGNPVGRLQHIVLPDGTELRDSAGGSSGGRGGSDSEPKY